MKQPKFFRVGSKVKIISSTKKKVIGKTGYITEKRVSFFGNSEEYCVLYDSEHSIWQTREDLEKI